MIAATDGTYRETVGRGARLPGEIGGSSFVELIKADGSIVPVAPWIGGGLSGESFLPEDVPEIDIAAVRSGVRVCCLAVVESAYIENGAHSVKRLGLSAWDLDELPSEAVFIVLTAVTKRAEESLGYFVSLVFDGEEKARFAVSARESMGGYATVSACFRIGAFFESVGRCKIVAHASGILLCETVIDLRLRKRIGHSTPDDATAPTEETEQIPVSK